MISRQQLGNALHSSLRQWQDANESDRQLRSLALFRLSARRGVTAHQFIANTLEQLALTNSEGAQILKLHYIDGLKVHTIAHQLALHEGTVHRKQRDALDQLTENVYRLELEVQDKWAARAKAHLEQPTYLQLFGVQAYLDQLITQATKIAPPWIIAIEGVGGIGKTALADALTRRLIEDGNWADVGWVTARQQTFDGGGAIEALEQPRLTADNLLDVLAQQLLADDFDPQALTIDQKKSILQERLHSDPHLIVVDNLETLTDVRSLLTTLRDFAGPSKILLTSRVSWLFEKDIFHFVVPELSRSDSLAMLRYEASVRNAPGLASAADAELRPILQTVGGNPLALRLVVGQLLVHPLGRVLDDLRHARSRQANEIYTYIYRQAWNDLDERAQRTLLLMPLVTESGGDLAYLTSMAGAAGLSAGDVSDALVQLVSRNLVDSRGDLETRRYTIHSLTRQFVQQEILRWSAPGLDIAE